MDAWVVNCFSFAWINDISCFSFAWIEDIQGLITFLQKGNQRWHFFKGLIKQTRLLILLVGCFSLISFLYSPRPLQRYQWEGVHRSPHSQMRSLSLLVPAKQRNHRQVEGGGNYTSSVNFEDNIAQSQITFHLYSLRCGFCFAAGGSKYYLKGSSPSPISCKLWNAPQTERKETRGASHNSMER